MKLVERKFADRYYDYCDGFWDKDSNFVCIEQLSLLFDIPQNAETIWLSLHTRPAKNRVKMEVIRVPGHETYLPETYLSCVVEDIHIESGEDLARLIEKYVGNRSHVYLECWYEEPQNG